MQLKVEMHHDEVKQAIADYLRHKSGISVQPERIILQVKSKQNYKSDWEEALTRVFCDVPVETRR